MMTLLQVMYYRNTRSSSPFHIHKKSKKDTSTTPIDHNCYHRLPGAKAVDHIMLATVQTQSTTVQRANNLNIRGNRWRETKKRIQGNSTTINNGYN